MLNYVLYFLVLNVLKLLVNSSFTNKIHVSGLIVYKEILQHRLLEIFKFLRYLISP